MVGTLAPRRNRVQPELSAFLTHLCDPSGEADQASRSAPAPAVLWFRLGRGTRLSDPGITTSRRQLRQRGGRRAAAGHGGVFCRALPFSRDPWVPVSFALSRPECPSDGAGQSQACEQSWGSRTALPALASSQTALVAWGAGYSRVFVPSVAEEEQEGKAAGEAEGRERAVPHRGGSHGSWATARVSR